MRERQFLVEMILNVDQDAQHPLFIIVERRKLHDGANSNRPVWGALDCSCAIFGPRPAISAREFRGQRRSESFGSGSGSARAPRRS